jgi:hypothetical protein
MEAGMGFEPALYGRSFMRRIIVNDEMEIETGGGLPVDQSEKAQELAMSMARHAGRDNLAIQHVQRCEQGRILQQPVQFLRRVAAAPATDRQQALVHSRRNPLRCQSIARQQHDPRPPNHLLRCVAVPNQPLQSFAISRADPNLLDFPHRRRLAGSRRFVNRLSATEH